MGYSKKNSPSYGGPPERHALRYLETFIVIYLVSKFSFSGFLFVKIRRKTNINAELNIVK